MTDSTNSRIRPVSKFFFEGDRKFFIKGATYGPFKPDAKGDSFGRPEQVDVDLRMMREIGLNLLRVYYPPPEWFLEKCLAAGIRVLITLPWEKHVEFLRQKKVRDDIARKVRNTVRRYVDNQRDFERYLLRLQNLTGERPLILGEFGMDTIRHSQDEQAEMLGWHIESVAKCGLAGTILFSWTDEWFTGGNEVMDWAFGI